MNIAEEIEPLPSVDTDFASQIVAGPSSSNESYVLSTVIRGLNLVEPTDEHLQGECANWGRQFVRSIHLGIGSTRRLQLGHPIELLPTLGNGDCLFSSMSNCLTGSVHAAGALRALICDCMEVVPFRPGHFERYSRSGVSTVPGNLEVESMRSGGAYGCDLEKLPSVMFSNFES